MKVSGVIVLEKAQIMSLAWLGLTGCAQSVYLLFRCRCRIEKLQGKRRRMFISNNGELVFTYKSALNDYGITAPRFRRAIDELIISGFIDIAATGQGTFKAVTFYAISDRWRAFGTKDYVAAKRSKRGAGYPGFHKKNKLWQERLKKKSTDANVHGAMYANVRRELIAMYTNVHGQKVKILYKWSKDKWLSSKIA